MQDEVIEYETVEKEKEVTETVVDYDTEERRYKILRCDSCEGNLGPIDDPDPHATVAVNPSVKHLRTKVENPNGVIASFEESLADKVTTMDLQDNMTVRIGAWELDVMNHKYEKPTDRGTFISGRSEISAFEAQYGSNIDWSTYHNIYHSTGSMYHRTKDTLNLVLYEDVIGSIWQADWDIQRAKPEIECDVTLDLCEGCAESLGASIENGNATYKERDNSTEDEESDEPPIKSEGLLVIACSMLAAATISLVVPYSLIGMGIFAVLAWMYYVYSIGTFKTSLPKWWV